MSTDKMFHCTQLSKEYNEHPIFDELSYISNCYKHISYASIGFIPSGYDVKSLLNIDTYIMSSIRGTIHSIQLLLKNGLINDAFAIARKYFDEILFDIYQSVKREDYNHNDIHHILYINQELQRWRESTIRIPKIDVQIKYLQSAITTKDLMALFDFSKKGKYHKIRQYLDDNTHMCSYLHLLKNDNQIFNSNRINYLNRIKQYLIDLFVFHLSAIFVLHGQYMMASDFRDCIDLGLIPPEGSEHWIAPWAQKVFDKYIAPNIALRTLVSKSCILNITL